VLYAITNTLKHRPFITVITEDTQACLQKPNADKACRLDCTILIRRPDGTEIMYAVDVSLVHFTAGLVQKIRKTQDRSCSKRADEMTAADWVRFTPCSRQHAALMIGAKAVEEALQRRDTSKFKTYSHITRKMPTGRVIKLVPVVLTSGGKIYEKSIEGLKEICREANAVLQAHGHEHSRIDASVLIGNIIESALGSLASQYPTYNRHRATPLSQFDEEGFRDELTTNFFNVQKMANKPANIKAQEAANQKVADKYWNLATSVAVLEQLTKEDDEKKDDKKKKSFQQAPPRQLGLSRQPTLTASATSQDRGGGPLGRDPPIIRRGFTREIIDDDSEAEEAPRRNSQVIRNMSNQQGSNSQPNTAGRQVSNTRTSGMNLIHLLHDELPPVQKSAGTRDKVPSLLAGKEDAPRPDVDAHDRTHQESAIIVPNKAGCTDQDANLSLNEEMEEFERAQTSRPAVALTRAHAHNFDSATTEDDSCPPTQILDITTTEDDTDAREHSFHSATTEDDEPPTATMARRATPQPAMTGAAQDARTTPPCAVSKTRTSSRTTPAPSQLPTVRRTRSNTVLPPTPPQAPKSPARPRVAPKSPAQSRAASKPAAKASKKPPASTATADKSAARPKYRGAK
jgi:hypothetical protein